MVSGSWCVGDAVPWSREAAFASCPRSMMMMRKGSCSMVRWAIRMEFIVCLRVVFILLMLAENWPTFGGHQFCAHSHIDSHNEILQEIPDNFGKTNRIGWSFKREKRNLRQDPQDEPFIDGTGEGGHPPGNGPQETVMVSGNGQPGTSARADCQQTSHRLRSDRRIARAQGMISGAQSKDDDCETKLIETAVFLDSALDAKFSGISNGLVELNKLVLTIMNQVQHLFSFSSMRVPIKIKLVLVEHLKDSVKKGAGQMPNPEGGDIDAYLTNFCNWQANRLKIEKRLWWDHAILLSGLDLYKATPGKNHSGVLGLAWVGGMCKGNYSCTINEATNLESAFVIAHELGHSLGIMHDGQRNGCDPNGYIMSERTGAGKIHWSRCSISYLQSYINKKQLGCLDLEQSPSSSVASESVYDFGKLKPPGQVYPLNEQCKLAFGTDYSSFLTAQPPFNAVCRELWCVSGSWAKAAHPALEGSFCGPTKNKTCREGKCL